MLFTAFGRIKEYIAFPFAVIFFASVFILCPIKHYAEEKPVKEKITTDSQNKQSGNTGENNNKTTAAENSLYDYERPTVEEESYVWLFFKTLIVLAMLVGGFYYFYRFVTKKTGIQSVGREVIRILSIVPVGQNKFLQVVDLAGRIMVIGVSDSNINLITEIKDKDEIDRIRILSSKSSPVQPGGFQEYVSKYVSRLFKKDAGINEFSDKENIEAFNRETETDRLDFLKKQRERLKRLTVKMMSYKKIFFIIIFTVLFSVCLSYFFSGNLYAQNLGGGVRMPIPKITFDIKEAASPKDVALSLQVLFLLTILTLAPAIMLMMTSFTRIVIVLDFVKRALTLQQMPPNQVIVGLAIFLTLFVMSPTFVEINDTALQPYLKGKINNEQFFDKGIKPLRKFMLKQTRKKDIALFIDLAKLEKPKNEDAVPTHCLIPAFMISELKRAFEMGVYLFLPFMVIDMIIASALMAMGMIMLPPVMISLPFKLILFVLVDGWNLLIYELVRSFR